MRFAAIAVLAAAVALAGCQTTENYAFTMDTWVGSTEVDLVRAWGPPTRTYETGGARFLVYAETQTVTNPGTAATYTTTVTGDTVVTTATAGTPPTTTTLTCTTTFELNRGVIVRGQFDGNNCVAGPPTPEGVCVNNDPACVLAAQACLQQNRSPRLAELAACMRQYGYVSNYGPGTTGFVRA